MVNECSFGVLCCISLSFFVARCTLAASAGSPGVSPIASQAIVQSVSGKMPYAHMMTLSSWEVGRGGLNLKIIAFCASSISSLSVGLLSASGGGSEGWFDVE